MSDQFSNLHKQIEQAFLVKPNLGGTIHGHRKLKCAGNNITSFPSRKCGGSFRLDGCFEKALAVFLEGHHPVLNFRVQALRVPLSVTEYAIIDFLVAFRNGTFKAIEVKPNTEVLSPQQIERFDAAKRELALFNVDFQVVDSRNLKTDAQVNQILHLYSNGHRKTYNDSLIKLAKEVLVQSHFESLPQITHKLTQEGFPTGLAQYLVFHKHITSREYIKLLDFSELAI